VTKEIHARLKAQGLQTIPLPLGTPPTQPHVPILTSPDLPTKSRVVLLFGESCQSLGVLAHRVIGGRGGINRGSVVGLVDALAKQQSSATDMSPPGVVIANPGELWWWPEGGRGLTPIERHRVPMASAVHYGRYHDPKVNEVPGNRTVAEHVKGVFETVVMGGMLNKEVKVDVIVVGDVANEVEGYLNDDAVWEKVVGRLNSLVIMGGFYSSKEFKCEGFKQFMKEVCPLPVLLTSESEDANRSQRARAYIIHHTPLDTPVAGAGGNPGAAGFTSFGCPVFSAGEAQVTETMLIDAQPAVLKWIEQVAMEGEAYKNVEFEIFGEEGTGITTEQLDSPWGAPETDANGENDTEAEKKTTEVQDETVKDDKTVKDDNMETTTQKKDDKAKGDKGKVEGNTVQAAKVGNAPKDAHLQKDAGSGESLFGHSAEASDMKDLVQELKDLNTKG
jgi:hypothetical protein